MVDGIEEARAIKRHVLARNGKYEDERKWKQRKGRIKIRFIM